MGGCRCTYRNCTVKTDGKTHMFHYPVFEKVRCHQWLINAHRLEFLDLKVSQLKNRVVCQHHFKDENFMNFKKDKLTFDAIPTEDGPYCDTTNYVENNQDPSKLYSIIIDETENEYFTGCEKKANFSTKYGDFLTNLDLMDIEMTDQHNNTFELKNSASDILPPHDPHDDELSAFKLSLLDKNEKTSRTQPPTLVVSPYGKHSKLSLNETTKSYQKLNNNNISFIAAKDYLTDNKVNTKEQNKQVKVKKQPKITIISEKKITDPVPITGKFEPVSPNFVLNISKKRDARVGELTDLNKTSKITTKNRESEIRKNETVEIEIEPIVKEEDLSQSSSSTNVIQTNIKTDRPAKMSLLKPRVPPERVEAINKKRKFNMKLRDIIETCLDKLENSDKVTEEVIPIEDTKPEKEIHHASRSNNSHVPSQDYTIAYLEARLKKMENNLLHKIDKNSKKISDLKNMYSKVLSDNKPAQSRTEEEMYKKHLYQEISKYLSPSAKSLIYEELFINKFSLGETDSDKRKRRRCI